MKSRFAYLTKKNEISSRSLVFASAPIAPKICHGQRQTMDSESFTFHPNWFISGGVIAERVNTVQTRHKVFPILGEATASSPSNKSCAYMQLHYDVNTGPNLHWMGSVTKDQLHRPHLYRHLTNGHLLTFRARRSRGEMYIGHGCLCVCLSVPRRIPTLLHGPGCNLGE